MLTITLYHRKNDPASDAARSDLHSLKEKFPHELLEVDVASDPVLQKAYEGQVPVIEVGPYSLKSPFDKQKLEMTLGAASDREGQLKRLGREDRHDPKRTGKAGAGGDRLMFWISRHYLAILNVFILFYFGLPIAAPALMKAGAPIPAGVIYTLYKPLCHQFGFRSFFLFGEQAYYPLAEAGVAGVKTFEEATGIVDVHDPTGFSRFEARDYIGNETVGYKVALCERDIAIYGSILLFGLVYAVTGRRLKPLHWMMWIVIGMGPIGLDGFSQLFSQMEWSWLVQLVPYRESTPLLRALTGGLFGFATAWFAYPNMEESMAETRQFFVKKFASTSQISS
jgi:uncharacterized membrane protein